jgi:hypothetical protein
MLKNRILLILLAILLIIGTGCVKGEPTNTSDAGTQASQPTAPEGTTAIIDRDGNKIGAIDENANFTALGDGVFYSVWSVNGESYTGDAEYHYFSLKDKNDTYLGKLQGQGYEAFYTRTEQNGVIYTLAVKGNPYGTSSIPLLLLAFDTARGTMKTVTVSENGFPYTSMAVSGGKLYIMNHEMTAEKSDKIYRYDPDTDNIEEVLSFSSGIDSLRGVCAADDGFYLLRLKLTGGAENELYLDKYDNACVKQSETALNSVMTDALMKIHGISGRQDALNELGMNVSRFAVIDGRYLIYENFGLSRAAVDLKSVETLLAKDDNYSVSMGDGSPVIYKLDLDKENVTEPEIWGVSDGVLKRFSFKPDGSCNMIQRVSRSDTGVWAILTSDDFPVQSGAAVIRIWAE